MHSGSYRFRMGYDAGLVGAGKTGADLTGATIADATLTGADFTSATLSGLNVANLETLAPEPGGTATTLPGAFLQGTNLTGAIIPNSLSLANAYVDFTATGNTINVQLPGAHTLFPGYWGAAGEPICAQMAAT